jgi:hypothetical protein
LHLLLACIALLSSAGAHARPPLSAGAACESLKQAVTKAYRLPQSTTHTWHCDFQFGATDPALWVINLRSNPRCKGFCGGTFAVRKDNGQVGRFDFRSGTLTPLKP